MAEIRVEQKRRASGWPWLLLALLLIGAAAWYFGQDRGQLAPDAPRSVLDATRHAMTLALGVAGRVSAGLTIA